MSHSLRRGVSASFAVLLVFFAFLVFDSAVVAIKLQRMAAGREGLDLLNHGFPWAVVLMASSVIPSFVLQAFRVSRYAAYLIVGALSGWIAIYSFWFEFMATFTLFASTPEPRAFGAVLVDAVTGMATSLGLKLDSGLFWTVPACCLFGVVCGWLYWLLAVRRIFRKRKSLVAG